MTGFPDAGLAEVSERRFEFVEAVRFRAEVAEVVVALLGLFLHHALHIGTVVAVECIAFDEGGRNPLAPEYLFEDPLDRGGAGAGGTGDGDDRMFDCHSRCPVAV